jgi:hypothetical protein
MAFPLLRQERHFLMYGICMLFAQEKAIVRTCVKCVNTPDIGNAVQIRPDNEWYMVQMGCTPESIHATKLYGYEGQYSIGCSMASLAR